MHQFSLNLIQLDFQNKYSNTHLEEGISLLTTAEAVIQPSSPAVIKLQPLTKTKNNIYVPILFASQRHSANKMRHIMKHSSNDLLLMM